MMWNEEELIAELENYFKTVTKEQFIKDITKAGCLHLIEDVKE